MAIWLWQRPFHQGELKRVQTAPTRFFALILPIEEEQQRISIEKKNNLTKGKYKHTATLERYFSLIALLTNSIPSWYFRSTWITKKHLWRVILVWNTSTLNYEYLSLLNLSIKFTAPSIVTGLCTSITKAIPIKMNVNVKCKCKCKWNETN